MRRCSRNCAKTCGCPAPESRIYTWMMCRVHDLSLLWDFLQKPEPNQCHSSTGVWFSFRPWQIMRIFSTPVPDSSDLQASCDVCSHLGLLFAVCASCDPAGPKGWVHQGEAASAAPRMELPGCVALHFQGLNCLHMQWYKNGCMEIRQQCLPNLQREVSGPGSGCIPTPKGNLGKLGYFCFSMLCEAAGCKYKDPSKSPTTKAAHGSQHHLVL